VGAPHIDHSQADIRSRQNTGDRLAVVRDDVPRLERDRPALAARSIGTGELSRWRVHAEVEQRTRWRRTTGGEPLEVVDRNADVRAGKQQVTGSTGPDRLDAESTPPGR